MPDIQAFRGIRYDLGHVGAFGNVVAPPYDVIGPDYQKRLYERHPANVVRLILNREEPGDDDQNNKYRRAARFLKNWQSEGVLFTEGDPAIYVYHQQFDYSGRTYVRRGFMARCRLSRFGEGNIYPHEITMSGPKQDRLLLTRACQANLSQIFGLYPDTEGAAQAFLERAITGQRPIETSDDLQVVHRVWPVTDVKVIADLVGAIGPKPIFIADGHHRYETACNYRDELAAQGPLGPNHPANFVLMYFNGMSDPGLIVLPTHRLFRGLPQLDSSGLAAKLGDSFTCQVAGEGADLADTVWRRIESEEEQGTIGLFTAQDERWTVARITEAGRGRLATAAPEQSQDWRDLGVSILHKLIVETLLGIKEPERPDYVHLVNEVVAGLDSPDFPLAALVMPATLDHIRSISEHGERMPAKSTYFYPKVLSGLVINPLT
jgi:uncharacterized protein (DUF1015 family)